MALALSDEGVYGAGMADESTYPNDLAACHSLLHGKDRLIDQQFQRLEEQKAQIAKLQAERDAALQLAFRKKIERYLPDPKQFVLDFGDSPDVVDAAGGSPIPPWRRLRATSGGSKPPKKPVASSSRPTCRGTK